MRELPYRSGIGWLRQSCEPSAFQDCILHENRFVEAEALSGELVGSARIYFRCQRDSKTSLKSFIPRGQ
jgi:hypothetical protein